MCTITPASTPPRAGATDLHKNTRTLTYDHLVGGLDAVEEALPDALGLLVRRFADAVERMSLKRDKREWLEEA